MKTYETILIETHKQVGLIRLNRPKALNAINSSLMIELLDALQLFDQQKEIGVIVITGNDQAFAAGADIKEMVDASAVDMLVKDHISLFDRLREIKKPVIAAVSGWCLGGGNELAMACDMIVASESARFGQPEITIGVIPGAGGTQRLTRSVGKAIAMEMILNNRNLSAQEALQYGLINRLAPVERYLEEAINLAEEIAHRAPLAIRLAKEAVNHAYESFLADGIKDERRSFYFLFASQDQSEGMNAFIEKRSANWQGR